MNERRKALIRKRAKIVADAAIEVNWTQAAYIAWDDLHYIADYSDDPDAAAYAEELIDQLDREQLIPYR